MLALTGKATPFFALFLFLQSFTDLITLSFLVIKTGIEHMQMQKIYAAICIALHQWFML